MVLIGVKPLNPGETGRHFEEDIRKCIFLKEKEAFD